ncbi:hypothetical protein BDN72DRAFT_902121 [Pluteus cervinus]|uniref:Uncharacterized protein n=1 Tax=Pluteus cervinus TaxID=181527 RepID=A0ACD3AEB8_9AGAR|nr:hypothetical protein BDN72DRAFT_902121 [Pluteus cervinus]
MPFPNGKLTQPPSNNASPTFRFGHPIPSATPITIMPFPNGKFAQPPSNNTSSTFRFDHPIPSAAPIAIMPFPNGKLTQPPSNNASPTFCSGHAVPSATPITIMPFPNGKLAQPSLSGGAGHQHCRMRQQLSPSPTSSVKQSGYHPSPPTLLRPTITRTSPIMPRGC